MKLSTYVCTLAVAVLLSISAEAAPPGGQSQERPNVVVIMVDDLGFSDIGCYGSEIETPNLDALAADGLRFSQFYNTAKCHSSRVSLLTGQYCIAAGDKALSHAVTSAEVLRDAGYFTAMTGKWHLKKEPTDFGFDRYFGHLSGVCNYFKGDETFRLNGEPWKVPMSDFYTTVADVDFALDFLEEARKSKKPFYLYVAFNAPHCPLQALPDDYAKYKGRYDSGWDKVRDARIAKQKKLGLLPMDLEPSPRPPHIRAWDKLVP
ncbi:MAG: sulfatase-like hydrolase/transferase, partial [Planctomycetes bacterium]|nr:sulfatase-like hydrolase/transferase [Planctomycetota bacterium]